MLNSQKWLHHIGMRDKHDPNFEVPGINLIFLELAKRKKIGNFNFEDPIDRWLSFLIEPEKIRNMTKFDLSVYPNLLKAAELLDASNYNQSQLDAYDRHLLAVYDINRSRIESYDEGYDEGRVEGRIEGRLEGRVEGREEGKSQTISILRDLKDQILSHAEIATKHGVDLDEVIRMADAFR